MSYDNIIVANIGWSAAYEGERISSSMSYVAEHGTGAEAYNFSPATREGLFYGYIRGGGALAARSDRLWTIVFVSKPRERDRLRVVGWYEDAVVGGYRSRPEYGYDPAFPKIRNGEPFIYSAITSKAYVVPANSREVLTLPPGHRIGSAGLYYAAGEGDEKGDAVQRASRRDMAEWLRHTLPSLRASSRLAAPSVVRSSSLPGIEVDDGGSAIGYSPVAESDEHRELRLWAKANPKPFTGRAGPSGETEWALPSGDRVDAVHETNTELWLIEAKSRRSTHRDLERGVYQAIKYRAVAQAMDEAAGRTRSIHAILLTETELPPGLVQLAARNEVLHVQHRLNAEAAA